MSEATLSSLMSPTDVLMNTAWVGAAVLLVVAVTMLIGYTLDFDGGAVWGVGIGACVLIASVGGYWSYQDNASSQEARGEAVKYLADEYGYTLSTAHEDALMHLASRDALITPTAEDGTIRDVLLRIAGGELLVFEKNGEGVWAPVEPGTDRELASG